MTAAGGGGSAVEYPLNGEVDIVTLALTCDFDTIGEGGDGAVCPAGAAVAVEEWCEGGRLRIINSVQC